MNRVHANHTFKPDGHMRDGGVWASREWHGMEPDPKDRDTMVCRAMGGNVPPEMGADCILLVS